MNWATIKNCDYYTEAELSSWIILAVDQAQHNLQLIEDLKTQIATNHNSLTQAIEEEPKSPLRSEIIEGEKVISKCEWENSFLKEQLTRLLNHSFLNDKPLATELKKSLLATLHFKREQLESLQKQLTEENYQPIVITPAQENLLECLIKYKPQIITQAPDLEPLITEALSLRSYSGYQRLLTELSSEIYSTNTEFKWISSLIAYYLELWHIVENTQEENTQLKDKILDLKTQLLSHKSKVSTHSRQWSTSNDKLIKEKNLLERQITKITKEKQELSSQNQELTKEIENLKAKIVELETENEEHWIVHDKSAKIANELAVHLSKYEDLREMEIFKDDA
jgi:chromosome segregation ATPase